MLMVSITTQCQKDCLIMSAQHKYSEHNDYTFFPDMNISGSTSGTANMYIWRLDCDEGFSFCPWRTSCVAFCSHNLSLLNQYLFDFLFILCLNLKSIVLKANSAHKTRLEAPIKNHHLIEISSRKYDPHKNIWFEYLSPENLDFDSKHSCRKLWTGLCSAGSAFDSSLSSLQCVWRP